MDTCQERPVGSRPSSGRRVLSAHRTLTRRARPPTAADQVQTAALQFRRLNNDDATARPHRSPSLPRNASTRWYSPAQLSFGSHDPTSQRLPYPRTNPPWAVPLKVPPRTRSEPIGRLLSWRPCRPWRMDHFRPEPLGGHRGRLRSGIPVRLAGLNWRAFTVYRRPEAGPPHDAAVLTSPL